MNLIFLILLLLASPCWGAVAFDAVSTGTYGGSGSPFQFSWSHTVTGTSVLLTVAVGMSAATTVNSVTYNGVSLTQKCRIADSGRSIEAWYLIAPATGAHTVLVTLSASDNSVGAALSFTGVDSGTPLGTCVTDIDADPTTISLTVPTSGMAFDAIATSSNPSFTTNQTSRYNLGDGAGALRAGGSTSSTVGAQSFTWSSIGPEYIVHLGVPINAASTTTRRRGNAMVFQ